MAKYQITERGFELLDTRAGMPPDGSSPPFVFDQPDTSRQLGSLFPMVREEQVFLEPSPKLPEEDFGTLILEILEYLARGIEGPASPQKIGMDLKIPSEVLLPTLEVMTEENLIEKVKEVA